MAINMFEIRTMMAALAKAEKVPTFLRSMFFGRHETSTSEKIDVDTKVEGRSCASFVSPVVDGQTVTRQGFTTNTYEAPFLKPKRSVTAADLQKRLPGEHVYSARGANERKLELEAKDLAELDRMITRTEEVMCKQALWDASITVNGDGVDYSIDFSRDGNLEFGTIGAGERWDADSADPNMTLTEMARAVRRYGKIGPDVAIMGPSARDALLAHESVKTLLDTRRADMGQLNPEFREAGAEYIGRLKGAGLDLWCYEAWYIDPSTGVEGALWPEKGVMVGSTSAYMIKRYGAVPITVEEGGQKTLKLVEGTRVPDRWVVEQPATLWLMLASRPLPIPVDINSTCTATVLA
jgi:hypothetical protein